jgi:hypothetical protein
MAVVYLPSISMLAPYSRMIKSRKTRFSVKVPYALLRRHKLSNLRVVNNTDGSYPRESIFNLEHEQIGRLKTRRRYILPRLAKKNHILRDYPFYSRETSFTVDLGCATLA